MYRTLHYLVDKVGDLEQTLGIAGPLKMSFIELSRSLHRLHEHFTRIWWNFENLARIYQIGAEASNARGDGPIAVRKSSQLGT